MNRREQARAAAAAAIDFIEKQIATGLTSPGQRLPTERSLVERFGVARNTLRKRLAVLEVDGKIIRHVGRGTFIASSAEPNTSVPPAEVPSLERTISRASPAQAIEVRLLIEPPVAELAAVRATADELQEMELCLRASESAQTVAEFAHWDGVLHKRILAAARNDLLTAIYEALNNVRDQPEWARLKERSLTPELRQTYQQQHRRVVTAIMERDPETARSVLREHLLIVRSAMVGY